MMFPPIGTSSGKLTISPCHPLRNGESTSRAEQQAKAKAARPEGLAVKAMKAALTKPNGGVVGFHDANFEFHEALSLPPHPLSFPPWVPEEARLFKTMWDGALPNKEIRAALKRLATDRRMRKVWEKLKKLLPDWLGMTEIIQAAIDALFMPLLLRPRPHPKRREAMEKFEQHMNILQMKYPSPTGGLLSCATAATHLRYALESLRRVAPIADEMWPYYWPGDPAMSGMDATIRFLQALENCLIAIVDEQRSNVDRFPHIFRPDAPRAGQRFFAQHMSTKMQELCGRPCHDIVAALVCVAFDVYDVETKTVREWCRTGN
jgi:hypothetical protein